jgi:membrane protease YdiL (CAAX protease family)
VANERLRRLWHDVFRAPEILPSPADVRTFEVAALELPVRATIAISVVVFAVILDFSRTFIPDELIAYDRNPGMQRLQAIDRLILYAIVPLLVILVAFRDRPARYGLALGDWRVGLSLSVLGCVLMTPVVLVFAGFPDARAFYAPSWSTLSDVLVTNALDLLSSEFLFRGFLLFTLVRVIGPLGVLVATLPFVFSHLTKPELELLSTLGGGMVYGWLAWRTESILWGAIAHIYILTLLIAVAGQSAVT